MLRARNMWKLLAHVMYTLLISNLYNYFKYYLYYFHTLIMDTSTKDMVDMYVICDEYIAISSIPKYD